MKYLLTFHRGAQEGGSSPRTGGGLEACPPFTVKHHAGAVIDGSRWKMPRQIVVRVTTASERDGPFAESKEVGGFMQGPERR